MRQHYETKLNHCKTEKERERVKLEWDHNEDAKFDMGDYDFQGKLEVLNAKRVMLESRIEIEQQIRKSNCESAALQQKKMKKLLDESAVQKWLNS